MRRPAGTESRAGHHVRQHRREAACLPAGSNGRLLLERPAIELSRPWAGRGAASTGLGMHVQSGLLPANGFTAPAVYGRIWLWLPRLLSGPKIEAAPFEMLTPPTGFQSRALELLGICLTCIQQLIRCQNLSCWRRESMRPTTPQRERFGIGSGLALHRRSSTSSEPVDGHRRQAECGGSYDDPRCRPARDKQGYCRSCCDSDRESRR